MGDAVGFVSDGLIGDEPEEVKRRSGREALRKVARGS